jgi:hypothetical protein
MAFDPRNPDDALVVLFKHQAVPNATKSLEAGRPIYDDIEVCEIRRSGSRDWQAYPAHEFCRWVSDSYGGEQYKQTYAERFRRQYQQFKDKQAQTKTGTPLDQVPFLTEARRAELRAQNIYVVEQLAAIDGQELKNLGVGGREQKNMAEAFISESRANVPTLQLQAELEALRARSAILEEDNELLKRKVIATPGEAQFDEMSDIQVRDYIKAHTGHEPRGDLPRKTLIRMAAEMKPGKAA